MKLTEAIGQRLKGLLEERKWAYNKLETEGGISRSTVRKIAEAMHNTVKIDTLYQITQTLDISLCEFFDDPVFDLVSD
ncbi:MAG: helix-turn-helix domain-containing protein [Lachnospiraceae bacterium]|nr:helix-turn-helix domain-containing protein [Lachnospiraceae bacterium]MCM1440289.1 helix-turn-helix domain-containing protein [Roseburia sp.]